MTIFCNYAQRGLKQECKSQIRTNQKSSALVSAAFALLACLNSLLGHFWWLILIVVMGMVIFRFFILKRYRVAHSNSIQINQIGMSDPVFYLRI